MSERVDNRKHLSAVMPECGCVVMIMTVEDPDGHLEIGMGPWKASAKDIAEFYKDVHKCQTRKKNPLPLEVRHSQGKPQGMGNGVNGCEKCGPIRIGRKAT